MQTLKSRALMAATGLALALGLTTLTFGGAAKAEMAKPFVDRGHTSIHFHVTHGGFTPTIYQFRQIDKVECAEARAYIEKNDEYLLDDADVVLWAYGSSARSARYAVNELRKEGIKAGLFRPVTLWPFPDKRTAELAKQAKAIIVPEMNLGQMILEVERVAQGNCTIAGVHRVDGDPLNPGQIMDKVKEVI